MSTQQPQTSTTSSTTSNRPPVSLQQTTHLDPGAYVRGTHPITIGQNSLVHPRAQLISIHAPLVIGDNCIICEKAILGGPLPSTSSTATNLSTSPIQDPKPTLISDFTYIHPHSHIYHSATVNSHAVLEAHSTIHSDVTVGSHVKICAGSTVDDDVPDWTVVFGSGTGGGISQQRRRRVHRDEADEVEIGRLKAMAKERETATAILRVSASRTAAAAAAASSGSAGAVKRR